MITIKVSLSTISINDAIRRLNEIALNLETGLEETVDILATEGGEIAQSAYGGMATAYGYGQGMDGVVVSTGENNVIAEFGAGDGVIPVSFENAPVTPVYPGSYSEQNARQYSRWGFWYFGGEVYSDIPARHGLLDAKRYIIDNSTEVARGAIIL